MKKNKTLTQIIKLLVEEFPMTVFTKIRRIVGIR